MTDPVPAHDLDAEMALLGACMLSQHAIDAVAETIQPGDFYREQHQMIYLAVLGLEQAGQPVDPVTVAGHLEHAGHLRRVGGAPYLHTLMTSVPTAANAGYYAERIAECALRRRLLEAGQRVVQLAETAPDAAEAVERARAVLDGATDHARAGGEGSDIADLAATALARYGSDIVPGLATPWHDLNDFLNGGLRPGTLTVVGARPGLGKSVLGTCLSTHVAQGGSGALLVSLEMPEAEVTDRILSALSRVTYGRLLSHTLEDSDWERVQNVVDKVTDMPLRIVDQPYLTLTAIRSLARSYARNPRGLGVLVVDYLQLMQAADPRKSRQEQVAADSRGLKLLAKELSVPVVALAQLNRGTEGRADKRPTMSDLRESGGIEQDADHILLLHRDETDESRIGELDVLLVKNRGGATGTITLGWAPHYQTIRSLAVGP